MLKKMIRWFIMPIRTNKFNVDEDQPSRLVEQKKQIKGAKVYWGIDHYIDHPDFDEFVFDPLTGEPSYKDQSKSVLGYTWLNELYFEVILHLPRALKYWDELLKEPLGKDSVMLNFLEQRIPMIQLDQMDDLEKEVRRLQMTHKNLASPEQEDDIVKLMMQFQMLSQMARQYENPILYFER